MKTMIFGNKGVLLIYDFITKHQMIHKPELKLLYRHDI